MNETQMKERISELEAQLAAVQQGVPALYQFQDRDGKWCNFMHEEHYKNTVKDGSWPIRALYTHPTQHGLDAQDVSILQYLLSNAKYHEWDGGYRADFDISINADVNGVRAESAKEAVKNNLAAKAKQGGV